MHSNKEIHHLIIRLFTENISKEERQRIDAWIDESSENKKLFNDLKEIWLSTGTIKNSDEYHLEEAITRFRNRIHPNRKPGILKMKNGLLLKYAAIFMLIFALPFSFYIGGKVGTNNTQTVISCENGDRTNIVLPDGSEVWLNSGSQLTFDNNFKKGKRQTYLTGEAYFSVKKDPKNPFVVNTSDINVEVLGTEFNLKAYLGDEEISTTLVTGSLKVTGRNQHTIIKPNQKLIFSKGTGKMGLVELSDLSPDVEWRNGRLVFMNESLEEMKPKLERWFDVEIEFADDTVKKRRFSGTLERESILEAIAYFGYSPFVAYQIDGNVIRFYSKNIN